MPQKLETVLKHVEEISNDVNRELLYEYHKYLISRDTSTNYQKDNIKLIYMFAKYVGKSKTFNDVKDSETVIDFLDIKRKSKEDDPYIFIKIINFYYNQSYGAIRANIINNI